MSKKFLAFMKKRIISFLGSFRDFFKRFWESALHLKKVQTISVCGMFMALRVVLGMFTVLVFQEVKIGFSFLPTALAGAMYGPLPAAIIGGMGDILGYIVNPAGGSYFPGFTVNGIVMGFIYGAFFYKRHMTFVRTLLCELTVVIFVELLLSSLWLSILYGNAYVTVLAIRLLKVAIMLPVNLVILVFFSRVLEPLRKKSTKI